MDGRRSPLRTTAWTSPRSTRARTSSSFPRPTNVWGWGAALLWTIRSATRRPRGSASRRRSPHTTTARRWSSAGAGRTPWPGPCPSRSQSPLPRERWAEGMRVRVRLFATYREIVGRGDLPWTLSEGGTLGDLLEDLLPEHPGLKPPRGYLLPAGDRG